MSRWQRMLDRYGLVAGELGAAAAQTVVVALLPVLLAPYAPSVFWIGLTVGSEGLCALTVPFLVGRQSDHLPARLVQRFGRRTFFLLLAAPVMAAALVLAPFASSFAALALLAFIFFAALHAYLTPLWALMIDAVPKQSRSRVQGARGLLRSAGLAFGFVGGGLLHALWPPLPFIAAGALLLGTTAVTWVAGHSAGATASAAVHHERPSLGELWRELRRNHAAQWFMLANASWSGAVDGIRPYAFLFAVAVLGIGIGKASLGLGLLVVGLGVGSFVIGHIGARRERGFLLQIGVSLIFVAFAAGFFARSAATALLVMPVAGVGAAAIVALAYPYFAELVGAKNIGQYTGLYVVSVGFGRILAPMLVGATIDQGRRFLPAEQGYPFMWIAAAVLSGIGALALLRARRLAPKPGREDGSPPLGDGA